MIGNRAAALILLALALTTSASAQCFELAPVRPKGGSFVPTPFTPVEASGDTVRVLGRSYSLRGCVPMPEVGKRALLRRARVVLNGKALVPPAPRWTLQTPAVAIAERAWAMGAFRLALKQTVEYDGFITCDLTLAPKGRSATVRDLTLTLEYLPDASTLYQIPVFTPTWAGFWPKEKKISNPIVGVWGGDDAAGFASYVATYRDWNAEGPRVVLRRKGGGPGVIEYRIVTKPKRITAPVTYRFGFIATPVRPPETRRLYLYALTTGGGGREKLVDNLVYWGGLSDYYATFRTSKPGKLKERAERVRKSHRMGKTVLAYTTYDHVRNDAVKPVPRDWFLAGPGGKMISRPIRPGKPEPQRVFLCPGSRDWIRWKLEDVDYAIRHYDVDGFYVDTSYIILRCYNPRHGHEWKDATGKAQPDFPVWSMREVWRGVYEALCRKKGRACIYAHHKAGCPSALAAYTSAFCEGEQYTSQPIANLTLDAFRAQVAGSNIGPKGYLLCEYYRAQRYNLHKRSKHHNPLESLMLALPHDCLVTGYPGLHPVREILQLRDDLGLLDAAWTPYYAKDAAWKARGAVVSSYRSKRGDTVLVVSNPSYKPVKTKLTGPASATGGRTFVQIDVTARVGRFTPWTPGYRWEVASPDRIAVGARSFGLYAWVRKPEALTTFATQRGFWKEKAAAKRDLPKGATLVSDFSDPDWLLVNDDGRVETTDRDTVNGRAMRVLAKPKHNAAALMLRFRRPRDWTKQKTLTFWIRPDKPQPVSAFLTRLRNNFRYGPALRLVSPGIGATLPAGKWTKATYAFGEVPRQRVTILRIYFHKGNRNRGPFDMDEMLLHGPGDETDSTKGARYRGAEENKPVPD